MPWDIVWKSECVKCSGIISYGCPHELRLVWEVWGEGEGERWLSRENSFHPFKVSGVIWKVAFFFAWPLTWAISAQAFMDATLMCFVTCIYLTLQHAHLMCTFSTFLFLVNSLSKLRGLSNVFMSSMRCLNLFWFNNQDFTRCPPYP